VYLPVLCAAASAQRAACPDPFTSAGTAMNPERILILHSFKDQGFEARLRQIASNPDLDGISFRHCCVIDRERPNTRIGEWDRLADASETKNDQSNRLLEAIVREEVGPLMDEQLADFAPDLVIIHSGTIFTAVPGACITMIIELMQNHPAVPFALEGRTDWLVQRTGRTYTPFERKWAISQNRWVKANFIDDDAVEEIIQAVF
jgi:hypothetical protein